MFCRNCGTQMNEDTKFCANCGTSVLMESKIEENKVIKDNTIKFQLKPKFIVLYKLLMYIESAFLVVFLFQCVLFQLLFLYPEIIIIALVFIVVYVIFKILFDKLQHKNLEYIFYATKIEYKDGFMNKYEKNLKYEHIREITMSQNLLERFFHIGTIRIVTTATSNPNGIYIHCIEDVQEQYKTIKKIIEENS